MSIERLTLPDANGVEQWVERQTDPSAGEMRQIEREALKVAQQGVGLPAEDVWIAALVKSWQLVTRDGETLTSLERKGFLDLPERTMALIFADLKLITDRVRPADAAREVVNRIVNLTFGVKAEDAALLTRIATEFAEVMGVGGPNPESQAA